MKEFIEKLIDRLEEAKDRANRHYNYGDETAYRHAIEIVNQLAEEYKNTTPTVTNGWIPCSERLPEKLEPVNITWVNRNPEPYYAHIKDIPFVATAFYYKEKWWWFSCVCEDYLSEYGKSECDAVDKDIEIIAWQPLPDPSIPKEEEQKGITI